MGRTKYGFAPSTKEIGATNPIKVRMPDGQEYMTKGKPYGELWVVRVPITVKAERKNHNKADIARFETGLIKGGCGFYIPERKMFLFKRTAYSEADMATLLSRYIFVFFGGLTEKYKKCMGLVKQAPSRKMARKILDKFYRKYGIWQYGKMGGCTRTTGLQNLISRKEEFSNLFENSVRITETEPFIAWRAVW